MPLRFSTEDLWERVVRSVDGVLISDLLPDQSGLPKNADYLFQKYGVIAELKRIVSDETEGVKLSNKLSAMAHRWMSEGKIVFYGSPRIELDRLPLDCAREAISLLRKPIQHRLKQANRPIKSTKDLLSLHTAHGLLILVHDGNYSLRPESVLKILTRCLNNQMYSSINSIIYVNGNMVATRPRDALDYMFFIHSNRDPAIPTPPELVARLQNSWGEELERIVGRKMKRTAEPPTASEAVAFVDSLHYDLTLDPMLPHEENKKPIPAKRK